MKISKSKIISWLFIVGLVIIALIEFRVITQMRAIDDLPIQGIVGLSPEAFVEKEIVEKEKLVIVEIEKPAIVERIVEVRPNYKWECRTLLIISPISPRELIPINTQKIDFDISKERMCGYELQSTEELKHRFIGSYINEDSIIISGKNFKALDALRRLMN